MKYIVMEVQMFENGDISTPTYAYDNEHSALAKYYQILSAASVSSLPVHSAMMFTANGLYLRSESFEHKAPEPEPEPPVDNTESGEP